MSVIYLLTAITCGLYSCANHYNVYKTEAECQIALDNWKDWTIFWPFKLGHGGFCIKSELSQTDIDTYLTRKVK